MFRRDLSLVAAFVACLTIAGNASAAFVSLWDFEGSSGTWGSTIGNVPDQWSTNTGFGNGKKEWSGPYQGGTYVNIEEWPTDMFRAPVAGMSASQGSYMWAWRSKTSDLRDWSNMITLPLQKTGTSTGIQFQNIGGTTSMTVYGGPSNGGGSLDLNWSHPQTGSAMDGNWHTFAVTYADGDFLRIYIDGLARFQTTEVYNAADYTLMDHVVLGNRMDESNSLQGDYDYFMADSSALTPEQVMYYTQNGYVPEPTSLAILGLAGLAVVRKRRN